MDTVLIQQTVITARDMKSELKLAIYLFVVQVVLTGGIEAAVNLYLAQSCIVRLA